MGEKVKKALSTFSIAEMLQVDPGSVANWIDQGLLKAHRTPGGHRRVMADDLMTFLRDHDMPIPGDLEASPLKVLVIDDEIIVADMIAEAVKMRFPEAEIYKANDGFQAGTLIATHHPDVVTLDLKMPGMDGFEVCQMIKGDEATRHTKVIAVTGQGTEENKQRILEYGADVFMTKPLDMTTLLDEVKSAI